MAVNVWPGARNKSANRVFRSKIYRRSQAPKKQTTIRITSSMFHTLRFLRSAMMGARTAVIGETTGGISDTVTNRSAWKMKVLLPVLGCDLRRLILVPFSRQILQM